MEESSSAIQDDLMSRVNILKEDLHDADRRADNSERQVIAGTNQKSLFRSRDWLSANQGPVFPGSVGS